MNLAVKYRPTNFNEICGQTITTKILDTVVQTGNFKNGYLFCGTSGTGKTTAARCFANAINKNVGSPIEIDAASNNGVDNVRSIIESANQRSLDSEYKVFIIDEAHMITTAGWNAFLKGIEEPSKYTIFIFCTTEPNKIPVTILNRLQRYNFAPISAEDIKNRLLYICQQEGFTDYEMTCDFISKISHGEMRNAITYLDQISDYSKTISLDVAKKVLTGISYETMFKLTWAITQHKEADIFTLIDELYTTGCDLKNFISLYFDFMLDLFKYCIFNNINITNIPSYLATENNPVVQYTINIDNNTAVFNRIIDKLLELKNAIKYDTSYKSTIEVYLLQLSRG